MRDDCPSITAEHNAALRAIEALRPPAERICFDPLAKYLVPERLARATASLRHGDELIARWEAVVPGVCGAILARTGFIDDCLDAALQQGLDQLVILGAGFDTRALRFEALKTGVAVFELDHPATQAVKRERLRRHCPGRPDHIRYIPIRFEAEDLGATLLAHRYAPHRRTLFIWEGVTYYLGAAAVDAILGFITGHCGAGSRVVFDCLPPSVAGGTCHLPEALGLRKSLGRFGEALVFGIDPAGIAGFMNRRGFCAVRHLRSDQYRCPAMANRNFRRSISRLFFFVQAEVDR